MMMVLALAMYRSKHCERGECHIVAVYLLVGMCGRRRVEWQWHKLMEGGGGRRRQIMSLCQSTLDKLCRLIFIRVASDDGGGCGEIRFTSDCCRDPARSARVLD